MKQIKEIKEVFSYEEANKLLSEGWVYIDINTTIHPTVYILGNVTQSE
ncbi:hypothetical protein [Enterocloster asparagiformis]|uniref:Uncharacterized protein n=1 Tax=[Clostridium] asparagiforme DSM 15981 TaxID=518636 RepID=C0CVA6_9FIRM|nr:hypothetical protein [Enterocloster asparagiformis]EEG56992.1 hypothetical protein CLOSTASPAR_00907 [[Clostridium] asparagiforme DSM 15981]UWO77456.1 hypothetical protein NQ535_03980 [[Clostridium] asparagiforme DSM 15981]